MPLPKRRWQEPQQEQPFRTKSERTSTIWSEPPEEASSHFFRGPFRLLRAKPKAIAKATDHSIHPNLCTHSTNYAGLCTFPRFKRLRQSTPEQSHEKMVLLKKKNADTWISILAHLHRYSLLFQKTADSRYQDDHVTNILSNYNQISTARHLQVWQHFAEWCEPFGFHPANISTSFLLDFIYEATYQIQKQSYSMKSLIQSLKFIATQAEVTKLIDVLNTPVINGYISTTKKPQNPREVYPLPFHIAVSFEYFVKDDRRPSSSRLILGCYLFMFWTGLRFQDLQRTKPSEISLTDGILRAVCELSKNGQPQPAACIACGLSSFSFETGWGFDWFLLIQDWITITRQRSPQFVMDFVFPEVQGEGPIDQVLIPRPMLYYKAASILRHVAKQPFMSPPYTNSEVSTITVHSTKSALISAAKQLDLPVHRIAEQGHHRGKRTQGDRYSRDDTIYQLLLQKSIICKTRQGWVPLTPQARGGQHPVPQKHFSIPSCTLRWPSFLETFHSHEPTGKEPSTAPDTTQAFESEPQLAIQDSRSTSDCRKHDSSSESSSDSSSSSSEDEKQTPSGPFLLNHFTRIAHLTKMVDGKHKPSCGAKLFDDKLYRISDELPSDFDLCQRKGCSKE